LRRRRASRPDDRALRGAEAGGLRFQRHGLPRLHPDGVATARGGPVLHRRLPARDLHEGWDRLGRGEQHAHRAPAPLPRARAVARRSRESLRALEAHLGPRRGSQPGGDGHRMKELAPGVYSLGHGKGGHVHAFLLEAGGEILLVDTLFEVDARLVLDAVRQLGRSPADIKRIAITHAHRSHLGGLAALKRSTGATVYAYRWEADIVAGERRAQAVSIVPRQSIKLLPFQLGLWLDRPRHTPCPVDELLDEGDALGPLQVMHSPGHSPGHLTFWWPERRFLIAGDGIATWPDLCAGWKVFNLNHVQHKASLTRLASLEPLTVGVGHGEPIVEDAADDVHRLAEAY